ncbi:hypothetical protein [Rhodococcus sp. 11-3]|uniref:hypothetical protein n=1 Tax=Rhodococcus sp. 11-3 TaxID=2854796 RepID=UPI002041471B|nr:hypothetical protein [Rhodococcus sp. 11-3]USC16978.1 hypothetical protein KZJ41_08985 [Rhodococcus sp. 11-3]
MVWSEDGLLDLKPSTAIRDLDGNYWTVLPGGRVATLAGHRHEGDAVVYPAEVLQ